MQERNFVKNKVVKVVSELTEEVVQNLLKTTKSRTLQYLCRAYLQFGADVMSASDLEKIRKAVTR